MMLFKKNAQTEILGLVIIVILMLFGLLFVVRFVLMSPEEKPLQSFTKSMMATNVINAMLNTNVEDCNSLSMTALLQNCASESTNQIVCGNGLGSCDYMGSAFQFMLNSTLDKWGRNYDFYVCDWDSINIKCKMNTVLVHIGSVCVGQMERKISFIPTNAGNRAVYLDICS